VLPEDEVESWTVSLFPSLADEKQDAQPLMNDI
jgi:hypothetical protein